MVISVIVLVFIIHLFWKILRLCYIVKHSGTHFQHYQMTWSFNFQLKFYAFQYFQIFSGMKTHTFLTAN